MSRFITFKPIGEVLREADLITSPQLAVALRDQAHYEDLRLGEILALRGWIGQETADFFGEQWFKLAGKKVERPIGFYLQQAGLLSTFDIQQILSEQHKLSLRFGDIAIKEGLLKPNTVSFFLQNLFPSQLQTNQRAFEQQQTEIITSDDIHYWAKISSAHVTNF